jgi:hypothetical protein
MKRLALSLLFTTLLMGCLDAPEAPDITPEEVPDDVDSWSYVASGVSAAASDGSALNPYASVQAAIDAAPVGSGVKIQAGIYEEALTIDKDVVLSGLPTAAQEVVLAHGDAAQVISISGGAVVRIEDLRVNGGQDAVVDVDGEGTSLKLTDAMINCTAPEDLTDEAAGHGLVATNGAQLTVNGGKVTGCAMYGVLVDSAKLVVDEMTLISDHNGGGVRLEAALPGSEIRTATIENNLGFGVGLFCGELSIINSEITNTNNPGGGDGVVASILADLPEGDPRIGCTTDLTVGGPGETQSNTIESNQRAGVLIDGDVSALIQKNKLNYNGNGGVWLVGASDSQVSKTSVLENSVTENLHVGIGVVSHADATIAGNQVWDTLPIEDFSGETSHGDGIFVEEAVCEVYGNSLRRNVRYGILMREPEKGSCIGDDNTYEANMQAHKWEHAQDKIDPCAQTWTPDVDDPQTTKKECTQEERDAGLCSDEEMVPSKSSDLSLALTCESPTCLSDPNHEDCPVECGGSGKIDSESTYGGMVTNEDCSGCFVEGGPPCPNDLVAEGAPLPCCKPNSLDGLGVQNTSATPED